MTLKKRTCPALILIFLFSTLRIEASHTHKPSLGQNLLLGTGYALLFPCIAYLTSAVFKTLSPDTRAITSLGSLYLRNEKGILGKLKEGVSAFITLANIPQGTHFSPPNLLILAQLRLHICNWLFFDAPILTFVAKGISGKLATAFTLLSLANLGLKMHRILKLRKLDEGQISEAKKHFLSMKKAFDSTYGHLGLSYPDLEENL